MRRFLVPVALLLVVFVCACSGSSSDMDKIKAGTPVTVTMKDGTVVAGRFVEARPDQIVVDPFAGGEWQTLPRAQVASVKQTDAAETSATPPAGQTAQAPQSAGPQTTAPRRGTSAGRHTTTPSGNALRDSDTGGGSAPAPRAAFEEITVPANTLLHVKLEHALASNRSHVEDPVRASITQSLSVDGVEALPAGTEVRGVVTEAKPSGKVKGRAVLAFRFDTVQAHGDRYEMRTQSVAREAESTVKKDAAKIGIPAAGGALLGGILGGGKGAAIGAGVGGGAGTAVVLSTSGKEVELPAGTAVTVKLLEPLTLRVPADSRR